MIETAALALLCLGWFLFFAGTVGILRMPDVYTRLHTAGKLDTLGSFALLLGLAVLQSRSLTLPDILVSLKIMLVLVFVSVANPTATHALVDAGLRSGLEPWMRSPAAPGPAPREELP